MLQTPAAAPDSVPYDISLGQETRQKAIPLERHSFPNKIRHRKKHQKMDSTTGKKQNHVHDRTHIRCQYEFLRSAYIVVQCVLEWNPENHFVDSELRTAKGFAWLLNHRQEGLR